MKTLVAIAMLSLALTGCAEYALTSMALDNEPQTEITYQKDAVQDCKFLGNVKDSRVSGGAIVKDEWLSNVRNRVTEQSKALGGNMTLIIHEEGRFMHTEVLGEAYYCPNILTSASKSK